MHKFLNLNDEQFQELDESTESICEENEKYPGNALFFLTSILKSAQNMIDLCTDILKTKQFHKDYNYLHSKGKFIHSVHDILNKQMLPYKNKELKILQFYVNKAFSLRDSMRAKDFKIVLPVLKLNKIIYDITKEILLDIIKRDNLLETYAKVEKNKHIEITSYLMNSGRYPIEIYKFFLDTFLTNQ